MAEIITKEEFKVELAKLFPSEILGFKRPVEPLPTNIEFDTDMLQWISKDPAFFASLNMFFSRCLANDARLQEWVDQIFDSLAKQDFNLATTKLKGLMSAVDKAKLDNIQNGAEVNQNAFSVVKAGATNITATSESDTIEFTAGSNIVLTPVGKKITIGVNGIANGAEVNQNAFSSVQVGTTKINAATKTDILNIAAGTNISIIPDAVNKKITLQATGVAQTVHTHTKANITDYLDIFWLVRRPSKVYAVGDIAYSPLLPSWARLECVAAGKTSASEIVIPANLSGGGI